MASLLIIEDDEKISGLLGSVFAKNGYAADRAYDGVAGLELALSRDYSLILMDLTLPLKTGEEVLRSLRREKDTPVIVLSARSAVHDRIGLLRIGADDYITKPFDIDEVLLRVKAVLKRTEAKKTKVLTFRDMALYTDSKRVFISDGEMPCTAMEYAILKLLLENPNKIFSKRNLFESVTGEEYAAGENAMNVHMSNLRTKIRRLTEEEYIETVYGMGYRLIN